ncbi:MAG TPA: Gfo/Idh/MocA family oxidoreductase [Bryobacteraceae bacterium]|nr:Gfo/Idh/MocA family oxidoreductase [Bryobacteraceae bacterium]
MNRRTFLAAGAGLTVLTAAPSNTIRLGVIGCGGRGRFVMSAFQRMPALEVNAVCDVYEPNLENARSAASKAQREGKPPRVYRHYKELLSDKDIDAVLIATPEHWHAQMVLDAIQAEKDIYVEKPLCHTPEEGIALVKAERAAKQIIQVGMQRRSYDLYLQAREIVASGALGTVRMVRSWWLNTYLDQPVVTKLDGKLDWEQWQGPAPHREFSADRFRNWRYYSDYSGGILADQGAHVFDGIHMLMGAGAPFAVTAAAGKPHRPLFDMPESVTATAWYPEDFLATFSINYAAMKYPPARDQLNQLDGDKGRLDVGREDLQMFAAGASAEPAKSYRTARGFAYATDLHVANFVQCVRTRQRPTAPMALGFQSALVVQMANLSIKHGRRVAWNATAQKVEM